MSQPTEQAPAREQDKSSAWAPFASSSFTLLWTATLISNTGTWMHDVGASWLMTTLNPSPAVVSLVQAATTLPIFLLALLAGAIADRVNKKRMLLLINVLLLLIVSALAWLVYQQRMTPTLLLLFTLLIGTGTALMAPAWQAVVPMLVTRAQLKSAVALNSLSVNISRAIGPALAGLLIVASGLAAPFVINALSFLFIIAALLCWRPAPVPATGLPPEPLRAAMLLGLRHVRHNQPLRDTMIKALGFFFPAAAYWALLPLIARSVPGAGAELYGVLLGIIGTGAVVGALCLPRLRKTISADRIVLAGTLGTAGVMLVFALLQARPALLGAAFVAGFSWISILTCLNVSAQTALPDWVRARGLAIYLMVFFGSMTLGSVVWGQVASYFSNVAALLTGAMLLVALLPLTRHAKLGQGELLDLSPSTHWPHPLLSSDDEEPDHDAAVEVSIVYRVAVQDHAAFLTALQVLSGERHRNGAHSWRVDQDVDDEEVWVERFMLATWHDHLRQHQRVTEHDKTLQHAVWAFHRDEAPPVVRHRSVKGQP